VLRFDGANAHAFQQIGFSYYQLGELGQAFPFLLRAKVLDPNNLVARLKLGTIYLLGQKLEETREEATFVVLGREPKNFEALLLSALRAATAEEIDTALKRLEAVQADFGDRAKFHIAWNALPAATEPDARRAGI
jgi:cytochrome c-type biogenesis protein CcmH/NrfG